MEPAGRVMGWGGYTGSNVWIQRGGRGSSPGMVPAIQALDFARYRAFRDEQSVALSRLTLVYGENNAGKSALFASLRSSP